MNNGDAALPQARERARAPMLSSVAHRVYWLGRYLERVENFARLMQVYSAMLYGLPGSSSIGWALLLDIVGCHEEYEKNHRDLMEAPIIKFLLYEASNPSSVLSSLKMLKENARTTRETIPTEVWEQINELDLHAREALSKGTGRGARNRLFDVIIQDCLSIGGLLTGCMRHDTAYLFIQLGRRLERADMTTRIVDVGSISLLPAFSRHRRQQLFLESYENIAWMNILRSLSAYQAYRQHVENRVRGDAVVSFLLKDEHFPRSVSFCLAEMTRFIERLPRHEDVKNAMVRVKRIIDKARIDALLEHGLLDFMDELQISFADINDEVSRTWFNM